MTGIVGAAGSWAVRQPLTLAQTGRGEVTVVLGVGKIPADTLGEPGSSCRIRLRPVPWVKNGLRIAATNRWFETR